MTETRITWTGRPYIPWQKDIQFENALKDNTLYSYLYIPWEKDI